MKGTTDFKYIIEEEKLGACTIKKMMENKRFKNAFMVTLGEICNVFSDKKTEFYGHQSAKEVIPDCIINYPKIIIEPTLSIEKGVIGSAIKSVGELRLPFPKVVVVGGLQDTTFIGGGSNDIINITLFFVAQVGDGINVYFATNAKGRVDVILFRTWIRAENVFGASKMMAEPILTDEQTKRFTPNVIDGLCTIALSTVTRAVYMMTLQEGEVLISVPTPNEIATNKKRVGKGKKPLIEFRLITIDTKKKDTEATMPHGTHASPRQHWRRGHWRTAPKSGKRVWIDPMLVGDEANGKIIKDYAVGHYEKQHTHH